MSKKILWIEDDYYHLQGLVRGLKREGFEIVPAYSGLDAHNELKKWQSYVAIIVDLILPTSVTEEASPLPALAAEKFVGMGILRYMMQELKVRVPVIVLTVVTDPDARAEMEALGVKEVLFKGDLLPPQVQESLHRALGEMK